jgi:hypothetical protein
MIWLPVNGLIVCKSAATTTLNGILTSKGFALKIATFQPDLNLRQKYDVGFQENIMLLFMSLAC